MKRIALGVALFVAMGVGLTKAEAGTMIGPWEFPLAEAAPGTVDAWAKWSTGELIFNVGEGVVVFGVMVEGMKHDAVDTGSIWAVSAHYVQNENNIVAYMDPSGLPVGSGSIGRVLPSVGTVNDIAFSYTPVGGATTAAPVHVWGWPEPSTMTMTVIGLGILGVGRRRRRA